MTATCRHKRAADPRRLESCPGSEELSCPQEAKEELTATVSFRFIFSWALILPYVQFFKEKKVH